MVATFRDDDADPKEIFVYHNAGFGGRGGSGYIDSVLLRDRDADTAWYAQADPTREERVYYCQNWRADAVALLTDSGKMLEWVKYSPCGVPFGLPSGDTDSDGDFDSTDTAAMTGAYDIRKDVTVDGTIDFYDVQAALGITGSFQTLGRGVLTSEAVGNRKGYAGYEHLAELAGSEWDVRNRVLISELGTWNRRDPLGYVDGMNLYAYVMSRPVVMADVLANRAIHAGDDDGERNKLKCKEQIRTEFFDTYIRPHCELVPVTKPKRWIDVDIPGIDPSDQPLWAEYEIRCPKFSACQLQGIISGKRCCDSPGASGAECLKTANQTVNSCNNPPAMEHDVDADGNPIKYERPYREIYCDAMRRHPEKQACADACNQPFSNMSCMAMCQCVVPELHQTLCQTCCVAVTGNEDERIIQACFLPAALMPDRNPIPGNPIPPALPGGVGRF